MNKAELRYFYKNIRSEFSFSDKKIADQQILTRLINSHLYKKADLILIYVSADSEVDTRFIINYALKDRKTVAVPFCSGKNMLFGKIECFDELVCGKYGILTVDEPYKKIISDFKNALCIVPGICFDLNGARIGYGGGFYDRFLAENKVCTVGLCFQKCICSKIPFDEHDIKIDYILTENYLIKSG